MKESYRRESFIKADGQMIIDKRQTGASSMQTVTRVISFTSGKGGVGKTNTVVNIGLALARLGKSVLILDADLGLANVDILLGLRPKYTLFDVLENGKSLQDIMLKGPEGVSIIPASSGIESMSALKPEQRMILMNSIEEVAHAYDYLLIDTQAGIGADVMHFNSASSEIVCVINSDPTSLTDAYALIKILSKNYAEKSVSVIANRMADENEARESFNLLQGAVGKYLHIELDYLGFIPADPDIRTAVKQQRALLELYPSSPSGLALSALGRKIDADFIDNKVKGGMQFFFQQLLGAEAHGR